MEFRKGELYHIIVESVVDFLEYKTVRVKILEIEEEVEFEINVEEKEDGC